MNLKQLLRQALHPETSKQLKVEEDSCEHDWRRMVELTANIDECRKCGVQQSNHLPYPRTKHLREE